ncbi:hypothetical protein [Nocardioides sp. R-C-SC26]|uniref:hypothetical protein n=1 Tax=Nocardioides sp. R-C-SC26 TaxID=2870414 RepID=UPI001E3C1786|nr:hypothetical protein [Nocardioides sp. R-C-SC26]
MFSTRTRITALATATAGTLAGVGLAVGAAAPAHADVERQGRCGVGVYDFSVDREGRGYEVSVDLDGLPRSSRWKVQLFHNGAAVLTTTRAADVEGDVEVETYRRNASGADTFRFRATRVGGGASCGSTITLR